MTAKKTSALILNINTTTLEKQLNALRELFNIESLTTESFDHAVTSLCNNIIFSDGISTTDASGVCIFSCNAKFAISFDTVTSTLRTKNSELHIFSLPGLNSP